MTVETNEHLLQCPCFAPWRKQFIQKLKCFFKKSHTQCFLSDPLISLIQSYFNQSMDSNSLTHAGIFGQQSNIGWKNFFRGHIASIFQDWYEYQTPCQDHWTYKLLRLICKEIRDLWEIWNTYEHGVEQCQKTHKKRQTILNQLKKIYQEKEKMMAIDRDIFYETPEIHLSEHRQLSQVSTWISMMKQTIKISKAQATEWSTKNMKRISSYFSRQPRHQHRKKRTRRISGRQPQQHQTYIHFRPSGTQTLRRVLEPSSHSLTPRQIQPQIPWQKSTLRQQSISKYT